MTRSNFPNQSWNDLLALKIKEHVASNKMQGTLISKNTHPRLVSGIESLAEKCGLDFVPHLFVSDTLDIGPIWARKLPNAGITESRFIIANKSLVDMAQGNLHGELTSELETILAHEFSHLKDGRVHASATRFATYALPLVAMAGLWIYDKAKAKTQHKADENKQDYGKRLTENIHKTADEEVDKSNTPDKPHKWHADPTWSERILNAGRYAVVAAVGLAIGLTISRKMSLSAEFRADRMAVLKTEKPEVFKKILTQITEKTQGAVAERLQNGDPISESIYDKLQMILGSTIHAHPTLSERIAAIDKIPLGR